MRIVLLENCYSTFEVEILMIFITPKNDFLILRFDPKML